MDIERNLISKVLRSQDLQPVLERKITPSFFQDEEHRRVFSWVLEFWQNYSQVPTSRALRRNFPTYKLYKAEEPYSYYLDEMQKSRRYGLIENAIRDSVPALEEKDADVVIANLSSTINQIGQEVSVLRDMNMIETWEERIKEYEEIRKSPGLRGIPTGFPTIDFATGGLQPQQLITFVGPPKAGKSTMLLKMALTAHQHGKTPLFIGFEMSNQEQQARHDAMVGKLDYQALLNGRLTDRQMQGLEKTLRRRRNQHPFYFSEDTSSTSTVSGIAAKIQQYSPDVVFVDGVYMMLDENGEDPGSPQALTNITRSTKRLAQRQRIPIVISTQVLEWKMSKSKGITSDSIGYSSSFIQDSDVVLGVESEGNDETLAVVRIVLARAAPRKKITIRFDWETGEFEELEETAESDDDEDHAL